MNPRFTVRPAAADDSSQILNLIQLLADYERAPQEVINSAAKIAEHGFGPNPIFKCWVATDAEINNPDNIIAIAVCYTRYSTWKGPVLYLEDIVVADAYRRLGIGSMLFNTCLDFARNNGFSRLSWQVLEWNEPAIKFYEKYGSTFDSEWVNCSIDFGYKSLE